MNTHKHYQHFILGFNEKRLAFDGPTGPEAGNTAEAAEPNAEDSATDIEAANNPGEITELVIEGLQTISSDESLQLIYKDDLLEVIKLTEGQTGTGVKLSEGDGHAIYIDSDEVSSASYDGTEVSNISFEGGTTVSKPDIEEAAEEKPDAPTEDNKGTAEGTTEKPVEKGDKSTDDSKAGDAEGAKEGDAEGPEEEVIDSDGAKESLNTLADPESN